MYYLLSILPILTGFICIVLALFLLLTPSQKKLANRFFAIFLILTAIDVGGWLWIAQPDALPSLNSFRSSLGYLQMPMFLGFILATCFSDLKFRQRDALHFVPFAIALLMLFSGPWGGGNSLWTQFQYSPAEWEIIILGSHLQYYIYIAVCVWTLLRFRDVFRQQFSGGHSATFRWLSQLVAISIFAHTLSFIRNLSGSALRIEAFVLLQISGALLVLGIVTWITLKTLLEPDLFRKVDRSLLQAAETIRIGETANTESQAIKAKLIAHMDGEKPYLDPNLTLQGLADQLALLPRELSELINSAFGVHFFDFVNRHRIDAAKKILLAEPRKPVTDILYAVGFNSKSSFNTAFKKETASTPSAWRREHIKPTEK